MADTLEHDVFVRKIRTRRINGQYSLIHKIGAGGFGAVYLGRDFDTDDDVALKLEHKSVAPSVLEEESRRYEAFKGLTGFPEVYWYGWHDDYKIMAFELLGPSLEDLLAFCGGRFSLKTTLLIVDQLLVRLESLHSKDVIHRDVKPQNALLGRASKGSIVYVTDFGLADEYGTERNPSDVATSRQPRLVGTARFASIRGHEGRVQSPADDLESLGYMMVYFMQGTLPWQGLKVRRREEKERLVMERKSRTQEEELCKGLPKEFAMYVKYVRLLPYGRRPDYTMLREMFRDLAKRKGMEYDNVFDWTVRLYSEKEVRF